jgi:hypothetical protein
MTDYSEFTNTQINGEIAARLGYRFGGQVYYDALGRVLRHDTGYFTSENTYIAGNWAEDANMALQLLLETGYELKPGIDADWRVVTEPDSDGHREFIAEDDDPARVCSIAWLMWKDGLL